MTSVAEHLRKFEETRKKVNDIRLIVEKFLNAVKKEADARDLFISGAKYVGVGSGYEGTAVEDEADFDINLILAAPFSMANFKAVSVDEAGIFKLQYVSSPNGDLAHFLNDNKFLKVKVLRNTLFQQIKDVIDAIKFDGYTISAEANLKNPYICSLSVTLKRGDQTLNLDLVPVIEANFRRDVPGANYDGLPDTLRKIVDREGTSCFSLSPPPQLEENYSHLIVQAAFGKLEKEAMSLVPVRDAVCLTKRVAKDNKWYANGLRSFHFKRIAISIYNEIIQLNNPDKGYKLILEHLSISLKKGTILSIFISGHNLCILSHQDCLKLAKKIDEVK